MTEHRVTNIEEYIAVVRAIRADWERHYPTDYAEVWYRGVNDEEHLLLPGAYWRHQCDEQSMVLSFRAMAPMLLARTPEDPWDWYFLMQHYGLPTRLLDWTESPLHGLHFALSNLQEAKTPCVWVIDPSALNYTAHGDGHETVYVPFDRGPGERTKPWLPDYCGRGIKTMNCYDSNDEYSFADNSMPLAIYARRTNPRIHAQRGVFTIHGTEEIPLEAMPIANSAGAARLDRILIEPSSAATMLEDLFTLGFTHTQTYPEPESIAVDLKRMYKVAPQ